MATRTYMKCNKRLNSAETKPNKHQKVLETIVKNATQMWCSNPIHLRNPLQFLQLSSHCINDVYMEASQVHCATSMVQRISGGVDDERQYSLTKTSSNRKTKGSTIKDCKKNYTVNACDGVDGMPTEEAQVKSVPVTLNPSTVETTKSEPPPLAFYPKNRGKTQKPIMFSATEPPPLVPIARNFA